MVGNKPIRIISSKPFKAVAYFKEVLKYRELVLVFSGQEIKAMYAQTFFGIFWAIMRPLFTLGIFTIIFHFFLHVPTQAPYYLFAFAGLIAWNFFSQIAMTASAAIIQKQQLIHKMYFPKLILPLSKVVLAAIEMGISLLLFFIFLLVEQLPVSISVFTLPVFIALNIICGLAIAIWMNALNIRFRDLNQIIPSVIGIAIWVTPVFYPTTIIPKGYDFFVYINPMAGIIKGYRFALLGEAFPEWQYWISISVSVFIATAGIFYLSRVEDKIVDFA
jgi:lipopolysaccharide transport system permease protein